MRYRSIIPYHGTDRYHSIVLTDTIRWTSLRSTSSSSTPSRSSSRSDAPVYRGSAAVYGGSAAVMEAVLLFMDAFPPARMLPHANGCQRALIRAHVIIVNGCPQRSHEHTCSQCCHLWRQYCYLWWQCCFLSLSTVVNGR
eukprot:2692263-Rhodomonas_salina.2